MCWCVGCTNEHRTDEGTHFPAPGVTGGCELPEASAGNQTPVTAGTASEINSGAVSKFLISCFMCFSFLKGCASGRFWKILSSAVGGTVALCIGLLTSVYLATLHENGLWFSNIKVWGISDRCVINSFVSPVADHVDE